MIKVCHVEESPMCTIKAVNTFRIIRIIDVVYSSGHLASKSRK